MRYWKGNHGTHERLAQLGASDGSCPMSSDSVDWQDEAPGCGTVQPQVTFGPNVESRGVTCGGTAQQFPSISACV